MGDQLLPPPPPHDPYPERDQKEERPGEEVEMTELWAQDGNDGDRPTDIEASSAGGQSIDARPATKLAAEIDKLLGVAPESEIKMSTLALPKKKRNSVSSLPMPQSDRVAKPKKKRNSVSVSVFR